MGTIASHAIIHARRGSADLPPDAAMAGFIPYHPCMHEEAHGRVARLHLPVAPRCNIQCNHCHFAASGEDRNAGPGVADSIMTPGEALEETEAFLREWGPDSVVGIAGPGDPLANEETFEILSALTGRFPGIRLCLCTNGLVLPSRVQDLADLGVRHLSVTMHGATPGTVARMVRFVRDTRPLEGEEGASLLLERQREGIRLAVQAGMFVKINLVIVPEVNAHEAPLVARETAALGAGILNPMPLVPRGRFRDLRPPTREELEAIATECGRHLAVFRKCRQCRADARGIPGKEDCSCQNSRKQA